MCWLTMLLVHEVEELEDDVDVDDVARKTCRLAKLEELVKEAFFLLALPWFSNCFFFWRECFERHCSICYQSAR